MKTRVSLKYSVTDCSQYVSRDKKILATIFLMIALTKKIAKYSDVKRQTDHGQTELSNMLEECIK